MNWVTILMSVVTIVFGLGFVKSIDKDDPSKILSWGVGFLASLMVLCLLLATSYIERLIVK